MPGIESSFVYAAACLFSASLILQLGNISKIVPVRKLQGVKDTGKQVSHSLSSDFSFVAAIIHSFRAPSVDPSIPTLTKFVYYLLCKGVQHPHSQTRQ